MRPSPRFLTSGYLVLRFQRQYSIELCIYIITNETPRVETHSPSFPNLLFIHIFHSFYSKYKSFGFYIENIHSFLHGNISWW